MKVETAERAEFKVPTCGNKFVSCAQKGSL